MNKNYYSNLVIILFCLVSIQWFWGCKNQAQETNETKKTSFMINVGKEIGNIKGMTVSEDEYYVAVISNDDKIFIYEVPSNTFNKKLTNFNFISSVKFSQDGKYLAVLDYEKTHIFNVPSFEKVFAFKGNTGSTTCIEFDLESNRIYVGGGNREIKSMADADNIKGQLNIWEILNRKKINSIADFDGMITSICLSPNANELGILTNYEITIMELANLEPINRFNYTELEFQSMDFINSGFDIIVGTGQVRGWRGQLMTKSLNDDTQFKILEESDSWYSSVNAINKSDFAVYQKDNSRDSDNDKIEIRNLSENKIINSYKLNDENNSVILSWDGNFIIKRLQESSYEVIAIKDLNKN